MVDPERNPLEAQQLIQKYGVQSAGVVVASGNDRRVIDAGELAELDYSTVQFTGQPEMKGFKGEQLFTSALLQLSEGKKPRILFTTGHGELSLDDRGPGRPRPRPADPGERQLRHRGVGLARQARRARGDRPHRDRRAQGELRQA